MLLTKEALTSAQQALKASSHELNLTKCELAELRGELGSSKSQVESMRREMLLHKRCAALDVRQCETCPGNWPAFKCRPFIFAKLNRQGAFSGLQAEPVSSHISSAWLRRSLDAAHSQLHDREYELRASTANGFWTSSE